MEITQGNRLKSSRSDSNLRYAHKYTNNYALNIEKSLKKKLESTKTTEIEMVQTGGGITVKLDAVTFELFLFACDNYYNNKESSMFITEKTVAADRDGNQVQQTYNIKDLTDQSYTINAYLTRSTLLINGKNSDLFRRRDLKELQAIMSNTKIDGAEINIRNMNKMMAEKLEEAIEMLNTQSIFTRKKSIDENDTNEEKCYKCKRNCRTKAVQCQNGHWVHYNCEKLSQEDITKLQKDNAVYWCKTCTNLSPQKSILFKSIEEIADKEDTLAKTLLNEEKALECYRCSIPMQIEENRCNICQLIFHNACIDIENDTCFSCMEVQNQDKYNQEGGNQSISYIIDANHTLNDANNLSISINNISVDDAQTRAIDVEVNEKHMGLPRNDEPSNTVNSLTTLKDNSTLLKKIVEVSRLEEPIPIPTGIPTVEENNTTKLRDLRQLEQKLKKKEEQLKLKEIAINDKTKEKSKLMERLYNAEAKNMELEWTIKTLNTRIQFLEASTNDKPSNADTQGTPMGSSDELIIGIREKVTKFVLNKVENELFKLENQSSKDQDNGETNKNILKDQPSIIHNDKNYQHQEPMVTRMKPHIATEMNLEHQQAGRMYTAENREPYAKPPIYPRGNFIPKHNDSWHTRNNLTHVHDQLPITELKNTFPMNRNHVTKVSDIESESYQPHCPVTVNRVHNKNFNESQYTNSEYISNSSNLYPKGNFPDRRPMETRHNNENRNHNLTSNQNRGAITKDNIQSFNINPPPYLNRRSDYPSNHGHAPEALLYCSPSQQYLQGQSLYYNSTNKREHFLYKNSLNPPRLK